MATGLDMTAYDAALKSHYTDDRVEDMVYRKNPLFALCPKMEKFGGKNLPIPIIYGNPQGRSKTFANAQTRGTATSTLVTDFTLTRVKDYSIATIDNETLEASKGDANAFMEAATTEIDGAINSLTRSLAINMYRTSAASYGQVSAEPSENASTFQITLKDTDDVTNFEVGQMLVIYSALSGGSLRISETGDDEWEVAAVNRNTGVLTLTGTYDSNGTIAADDYIFIEGDRGNGMSGLADWIPDSDPGATGFFGVDRSVDVTRLGGHRKDVSALPIEEALIEGDAQVGRDQFQIDHYFHSHTKQKELKKALGTKVQYVGGDPACWAHLLDGDGGPIKVVADQNCPDSRTYGLCLKYFKLYSLGKAVRVIDTDGLQMLRQASDDGVEVRYGSYHQFGVRAPGSGIVLKWS